MADERLVLLKSFHKFDDMTDALSEATSLVEGAMGSVLETFLRSNVVARVAICLLVALWLC